MVKKRSTKTLRQQLQQHIANLAIQWKRQKAGGCKRVCGGPRRLHIDSDWLWKVAMLRKMGFRGSTACSHIEHLGREAFELAL